MRRSSIMKIGDLLGDLIRNSPLELRLKEVAVKEHWYEMMGQLDRYITSVRIEKGVLFVDVSSSVVKSELFMNREELLTRLNERAGEHLITKIVFR